MKIEQQVLRDSFEKIFKKISKITLWNTKTQNIEEVKKFDKIEFYDDYVSIKANKQTVKIFYDMFTLIKSRDGYKVRSNWISFKSHVGTIKEIASIVEKESEDL